MIDNISTLVSNSKLINSIRRRKNIIDTPPSASSIEEAKAKVYKILDASNSKKKKRRTDDLHRH